MKKRNNLKFIFALFFLSFTTLSLIAQDNSTEFWKETSTKKIKKKNKSVQFPSKYSSYTLTGEKMKQYLNNAPSKKDNNGSYTITLPLPDGKWETFSISSNSTMSKELAAKFPDLNTYDASGKSSSMWSGKLDYTTKGFHALLFYGSEQIIIQPIKEGDLINYIVFYKNDAIKNGKYLYESTTK